MSSSLLETNHNGFPRIMRDGIVGYAVAVQDDRNGFASVARTEILGPTRRRGPLRESLTFLYDARPYESKRHGHNCFRTAPKRNLDDDDDARGRWSCHVDGRYPSC
ncbi:MAG: hypothetical protein MI923_20645 [Phycisphaerales bacterium]|nr:hypothetical protein [Phycisphaerales bacterium]